MAYAIVEFKNDSSMSVVKIDWLVSDTLCHFPPTSKMYEKSIKKSNQEQNKSQWPTYDVKILQSGFGNYFSAS